jgi:hypothetical protein
MFHDRPPEYLWLCRYSNISLRLGHQRILNLVGGVDYLGSGHVNYIEACISLIRTIHFLPIISAIIQASPIRQDTQPTANLHTIWDTVGHA